ncbi:MAG: c-type cytochrome [Pseudomonadota bacterium]|nr:c-type cytochrome [Pseudomonadota bacterium]
MTTAMQQKVWPLLLALLLVSGCDSGPAPQSTPAPEPTSKVRVGDIAKGKLLATRCAKCHGMDGVSARSGAPFIAGLEQEYLVRSLLAYKAGARQDIPMQKVASSLSALQLADITAWYTSLETPWRGAVADEHSKAILKDKQARAAAQKLAPVCSSCHDRAPLFRQQQAIPSLAGMPLEYFIPSLKSYFNGQRHDQIMGQFQLTLSDTQIHNLGAWYAAQIPVKAPPPTQGNATAGKNSARLCAGCHGYDGNSLNPNVPNLAGQTADYLRKALKQYRDGQRNDELMREPVKNLSDATIANLAAYYALQQPESSLHKEINAPQAFNPLPAGKKIAASCDSCHGNNGNSSTPGIPNLTGLSVQYLVSATQAYQTGQRQHKGMQQMVSFLSDTDIERVAYHYAMQAPQPKPQPKVADDIAAGEKLSSACTVCHGELGISKEPVTTPSLTGQNAAYIISATQAYGSGKRQNDKMAKVAAEIKTAELQQIAAWFAAQTPTQVETWLPEEPGMIVEKRCSHCHGERGFSTTPGVPRLAGQSEPYIIQAVKQYQQGSRKNAEMEAMAYGLSLIEIKAIAAYYARQ